MAIDPLQSIIGQPTQTNSLSASLNPTGETPLAPTPADALGGEKKLLDLFDKVKKEATEYRWIWEREWLRDLYYVMNRQWIYYNPTRREWVDKRLPKWVPRPVTNKMAETLQAIRTNFGAVNLNVVCRPVSNDSTSIAAADIVDQMSPLIHDEHLMDQVMREADYWLIATGMAVLQISWDLDTRSNKVFIPIEQCLVCGLESDSAAIAQASNFCPQCGNQQFVPKNQPDGTPAGNMRAFGKGKTCALSPFEWAAPPNITRWDDLPYIIRMRWRDKHWFEANHPDLIPKLRWEKSPTERSMMLYKSLALANDIGQGSTFAYLGSAAAHTIEGQTEFDLWMKPTPDYPKGLVLRVWGDQSPVLAQLPEEGLPGPFPYCDIEGNPLFPFVSAQYEQVGGRLYGRSAISPLIQKQDQLNQLDSLVQLCVQRTANPVWVVPENAGIAHFTGEPGLVMKWNPLAAGGQAKPERVPGVPLDQSLMAYREQIIKDIEDLSGAFDIIKGQKPAGIEAFSALQLLVERSQSRFTSVFQSRGEMYRQWFALAIELERKFGPDQRSAAIVEPNKGYTFRHFQNAQLQGEVLFAIEDGSNMPKTKLGERAAIEQAGQMMLLNPNDPDQKFALLQKFGLSDLVPTLNTHVQAALQIQDAFEQWLASPQGPSPLVVKPWMDPHVHYVERVKWINSDRMREIMATNPAIEPILTAHILQLQAMQMGLPAPGVMPPPTGPMAGPPGPPGQGPALGGPHAGPPPPKLGGGGQAMANSNRNMTPAGANMPSGNKSHGPNIGPA